jgi:hypothetical protein
MPFSCTLGMQHVITSLLTLTLQVDWDIIQFCKFYASNCAYVAWIWHICLKAGNLVGNVLPPENTEDLDNFKL